MELKHGVRVDTGRTNDYKMRPEQQAAVDQTSEYFAKYNYEKRAVRRIACGMPKCALVRRSPPMN